MYPSKPEKRALGFRVSGFSALGVGGLGFRIQGCRGLKGWGVSGFRGWGFRVQG